MDILQKTCSSCRPTNVKAYKKYITKHQGSRQLYQCQDCDRVFSETKHAFLEGLTTPLSEVWQVIEAGQKG